MLLYILGFAILALLAIVLNDPMDPQELARFYAPKKIMNWDRREIIAPPMITGPFSVRKVKEEYVKDSIINSLPKMNTNHQNGYTIYEGLPQISVPIHKVSGYVDPSDPPPLLGIKINKSNGYAIIEGTPEITVPPGETLGLSLR